MTPAPFVSPADLPTRELMALLVDSAGGINTLRDLRAYTLFSAQAVQLVGQGLGFAVRSSLLAAADPEDHIEVLLNNETASPDRQMPKELTMLLSSSLGQLREISVQLLAVEALAARYGRDLADAEALERSHSA